LTQPDWVFPAQGGFVPHVIHVQVVVQTAANILASPIGLTGLTGLTRQIHNFTRSLCFFRTPIG